MTGKDKKEVCDVCMHRCALSEGQTGLCHARENIGGVIRPKNYGLLTAIALDPVEKKPLKRFHPESCVLSVGSFGCNLSCPFCQNHEISQADVDSAAAQEFTPQEICNVALKAKEEDGNIGVAYTYNEALVGYEFVRDTAKLVHEAGMVNVLVTNGEASIKVLDELLFYIDAMNIDLKGFSDEIYASLGGDLDMVKSFIKHAAGNCHIELTTLIVPGINDSEEDMRREAKWIASIDREIPLHITRFFPAYKKTDMECTDVRLLDRMAGIAGRELKYVYLGNI